MEIRTRIAPSPTGGLHIGHMRTILFDYALAKKSGGQFIIRIEDTDQERYVEGAVEELLDVIREYGISWDEGPVVGGKYGPYVQSERLEIYKKYAEDMVAKGHAYYCFLTPEETAALQEQSRLEGKKLRSPYRKSSKDEVDKLLAEKKPYVIRLKVEEGRILKFNDAVLGQVTFNSSEVDDQVLIKSDGFPTYHLAVVIDDHLMNITHILRGNDWLSSTPKHIMIYESLGWEMPVIAHLPNLKEKDSGKKLSKRFGAVFARQFLEMGYLVDALNNFLMLLGWSPKIERVHGEKEKELFTLEEFVDLFSLERVQKTALVSFDRDKLVWFNKEYLKMKSASEVTELFKAWLNIYYKGDLKETILKDEALEAKVALIKDRIKTFVEAPEHLSFFYALPANIDWTIKQLDNVQDKLPEIKSEIISLFSSFDSDTSKWTHEAWEAGMRAIGNKFGKKHGDIFMVLRVAVAGGPFSPPLFESLQILGKEEILSRLRK